MHEILKHGRSAIKSETVHKYLKRPYSSDRTYKQTNKQTPPLAKQSFLPWTQD